MCFVFRSFPLWICFHHKVSCGGFRVSDLGFRLPQEGHRSTIVEKPLQIGPIMQNKPNFKIGKMHANVGLTKLYSNDTAIRRAKNKPNSKPNKANLPKPQMNPTFFTTKPYENRPLWGDKSNSNPMSKSERLLSPCRLQSHRADQCHDVKTGKIPRPLIGRLL